jgi:hypothetical protein
MHAVMTCPRPAAGVARKTAEQSASCAREAVELVGAPDGCPAVVDVQFGEDVVGVRPDGRQ